MEIGWKPSSIRADHLGELVKEGFLPICAISLAKVPSGVNFPSEDTEEIVVFRRYYELGFWVPTHNFFQGLLYYCEIQPIHLSLYSYMHISIFIHLCEAFLGIDPHFTLFLTLFRMKNNPSEENSKFIGGAAVQFRQGMQAKYVDYALKDTYKN